ncbi:MAG: hypothetical protein JWR44_1778 [Hymenobacter sp.]|jgi:hypothetical protein|nr:hypothetical protein [Hymenobacter sp.]
MTTLFRTYRRWLLPALLLGAGTASAQLAPAGPLASDPARAIYAPKVQQAQQRTTALALPFFDDFTSPLEGAPKLQNWQPIGGALVSNRFALEPLTRGAATLDGLRANGNSYSGVVAGNYGIIDSLVSQSIDLGGLTASDQVYLSFAWQAGSVVSAPNSSFGSQVVRLELYAKTNTGTWERVWLYNSLAVRTPFRQQVIDLNAPRFLHGDFQFMFVARGNTSDNSDNWSVDYVLLDRGRARGLTDTTFTDVATSAGLRGVSRSGGLRSPLRRFSAMPVWQFNAANPPSRELNPRLGVNVTNLRLGIPQVTDYTYTVRPLPAGPVLASFVESSELIRTLPRLDSASASAARLALPITAASKRLRYTMSIRSQETNPLTLPNDTIFRDVELANYYAYDDGTAESFTELPAYPTGQAAAFAYRFDLNQPDYVRSLRLYPVYTASDRASRAVTISVWGDLSGRPSATPIATKSAVIPDAATFPAGWQYYEVTFDQPVRVTGTFYVGYSQPSQSRDLHYGLDLNSTFPAQHFLRRNNAGVWDTVNFVSGGALMMRPVMTNNVTTASGTARDAATFSLYPNPAHGTVTVAGPAFVHAALFDALGRSVWAQPAAQAGQPTLALPTLPAGVYTVRLTLPDGGTVARRLLLE